MPFGDWNGHVGAAAGVFIDAHGRHSFGSCNKECERVMNLHCKWSLVPKEGLWLSSNYSFNYLQLQQRLNLVKLYIYIYRKSFSKWKSSLTRNVSNFPAYILRVKTCNFPPRTRTWKLRDPVTASQFQSTFKVKTKNAATTAGTDADSVNHIESVWSKLRVPLLDAATKVSPWNTGRDLKPDGARNRWTELYTRSVIDSRLNGLRKGGKMPGVKEAKSA